ncbi:hypothetical protein ACPESR_32350, partial [Nocardia testacea]|uniref:hypothetical protein n=1 Tax=Nocardia testacea TaxID=248551 RepID=UPI003C2D3DF7
MNDGVVERHLRLRLEQARRDLEGDGWEILSTGQVFEVLGSVQVRDLEPDIVARRGNEILVGEVKSRTSRSLSELNELAEAVSQVPNARFEVYWLGSPQSVDPRRELIKEYSAEAKALLRAGHSRAAIVMAWSAVEGVLSTFITDSRAPIKARADLTPRGPWPLITNLNSVGYIDDQDYESLGRVYKQRNGVVHFAQNEPPSVRDIETVLDIVDRMANGWYPNTDSHRKVDLTYGTAEGYSRSIPAFESRFEDYADRLGPDHPETLDALSDLAGA